MAGQIGGVLILTSAVLVAADASAEGWNVAYTADVIGSISGGLSERGRFVDALDVTGDFNLQQHGLSGWRGFIFIENTSGGTPNEDVGTLQGVDNIEVERQRLRLYEAWLERSWGDASLRFGLYDLNSEFNATESASLLIAPSFGIAPEYAGSGPSGPPIFPSTALAGRFNVQFGARGYARAAILNTSVGVPGDPDGVDGEFGGGVLLAAEAGVAGFSFGGWRYSEEQPDIRETRMAGAHGVYLMAERSLNDPEGTRATAAFLRLGMSDGNTSQVKASWQGGVLIERVFNARPDSALSFGVAQAFLSDGFRANQRDLGGDAAPSEVQFELTYSDALCPRVTLQPDLQYIVHPGGVRTIDDALVAGLRVTVAL